MSEEPPEHSREDVWSAISKTNDRMSGVETTLAGFGSKLDSLAAAFQSFVHSHSKPTNWTSIAALIVSVMVAMAMWVSQSQSPIKEDVDRMERVGEALVQREIDAAIDAGKREARQEIMWELSLLTRERLNQVEASAAEKSAEVEALKNQLNSVDLQGSRVWNRRAAP